jgi:cell division protein FtsB
MLTKIRQYQETLSRFATQFKDVRNIGLMLFLVVLLLITWSGVKAIETNYGLQKQISKLEQQNSVQKLGNQNAKLQNDYYNTPQYLDLAAREHFGRAAPGETVLVIPRQVALANTVDLKPPAETQAKQEVKKPGWQRNFQAWLDFFLNRPHTED